MARMKNQLKEQKATETVTKEQFAASTGIFLAVLYGLNGLGLSLINKKIYITFGEIDPMNVLFVQTATNLILCLAMMTIKAAGIYNFTSLE